MDNIFAQHYCAIILMLPLDGQYCRSIIMHNAIIVQQYSYSLQTAQAETFQIAGKDLYSSIHSITNALSSHFVLMSTERHKNEKRNKSTDSILRSTTHRRHNISRLRNIFQKFIIPSITLHNLSIVPTNVQYHCETSIIVQKY